MPIPLFSLPGKDLQYALNCMDIGDLIAFSLCSNRTKALVRSSNRKIQPISADVYLNYIDFEIRPSGQEFQRYSSQSITFCPCPDSRIIIDHENQNGFMVWRKPEFTQSDWVAHFLDIFNEHMIQDVNIVNVDKYYLDTVKRIIPKFNRLKISIGCFRYVARMSFLKLSPIAVEDVVVQKNIFDNENDISKFLTLNLKSVSFVDGRNPFKLTVNDLLVLNITDLTINEANITGKELNRFLKLWMMSNRTFYQPKFIRLHGIEGRKMKEEVLRGIKCKDVGWGDFYRFKRRDDKELMVFFHTNVIVFKFK